jgi:hypothetical protein
MAHTTYEVSPCKGCLMKHGIENINGFNQCCYNTCASFVKGGKDDILQSPCGQACQKCMYDLIILRGKSPCEFWPETPVIHNRPTAFLSCMDQYGDPDKAYQCCLNTAGKFGYPYPNQFREMCWNARQALVPKEKFTTENFKEYADENNKKKKKRKILPIPFWIALAVTLILAVLILFFFIRAVTGK